MKGNPAVNYKIILLFNFYRSHLWKVLRVFIKTEVDKFQSSYLLVVFFKLVFVYYFLFYCIAII